MIQKKLMAAGLMLILFSCKEKGVQSFSVKGTLKNTEARMVYMDQILLEAGMHKPVDSVLLGKDGSFVLKTKTKGENLYYLRIDNEQYPFATLISDVPSITVKADLQSKTLPAAYEGSPASIALQQYYTSFMQHRGQLALLGKEYDSLTKAKAPDSLLVALNTKGEGIVANMKNDVSAIVINGKSPVLALMALQSNQNWYTPDQYGDLLSQLSKKYPEDNNVKKAGKNFTDQMAAMQQNKPAPQFVGQKAPEISLRDLEGHTVSLSSYKGKYVLVDFWASWCKPCREENPNVVAAYNKYKNKNFTVLGVSLDDNEKAWRAAVEKDRLTWAQTLDEKQVAAATYNVQGIPFNVLVDPDGKIIAESLRGMDLENKLQEVLK
ncbi:MAG: redoxin domain-containing protein [Terrimonas sp.]|nr:redoxin domain-containing protein [Terrimonas sp.]